MSASNQILLSEEEAVALLQPHVHSQGAATWLARDRQYDPTIQFVLIDGQPFYREADVVDFITHKLNPSARFIRFRDHLINERRSLPDRRRKSDRRYREPVPLQRGVERRHWGDLDRRLRGDLSRRAHSHMV